MNDKFFPELARRLEREGIATLPVEKSCLPVVVGGQEAMWVQSWGGIILNTESVNDPIVNHIYDTVEEISAQVYEYTEAMASAPPLVADGLHEGFRLLADFNGVVLAGQELEADWGYKFVTIDADELDMAVIRQAGEAFMKRPEVHPVWSHQLAVSVYEQIHVLKFEPGKAPEEITMSNTLEAFQAAVGGDIDVRDLDSDASLICNEDGKTMGLPANRRIGRDIIAGTFLIVGCADGEFCSLSDDTAAHYVERFAEPVSEPSPEGLKEFTFYIM